MAVSTANTSIALDALNPKKDAVVAVGDPATPANGAAIWAELGVNPGLTQFAVGTFHALHRFAQTNLNSFSGAVSLSCPPGGTEADIVIDQIPAGDECRLEIGLDLATNGKSHLLDRTFKRLIEAWLEQN